MNTRGQIGIVEVALALSVVVLAGQLFPAAAQSTLHWLDVRQWGWQSFAVASSLWIVALVTFKAWRDSHPS